MHTSCMHVAPSVLAWLRNRRVGYHLTRNFARYILRIEYPEGICLGKLKSYSTLSQCQKTPVVLAHKVDDCCIGQFEKYQKKSPNRTNTSKKFVSLFILHYRSVVWLSIFKQVLVRYRYKIVSVSKYRFFRYRNISFR